MTAPCLGRHPAVLGALTLALTLLVAVPGAAASVLRASPTVAGAGAGVAASTAAGQAPGRGRSVGAVSKGPDALRLLAQTYTVSPGVNTFRLRLQVTATSPSTEALGFNAYGPLTARSQFQAARDGSALTPFYYQLPMPVPLGSLPRDPAGGVDLDIPVNTPGGLPVSGTGVYPVQAFLEEAGARVGAPLTTFLVYAGPDAADLHRLEVALVVGVGGATAASQGGTSAGTVGAQAAVLAATHVPVTLQAQPAELAAMADGSPADKVAVADLRSAVASGDEVLPATAVPTDPGALVSAGLVQDLQTLLLQGAGSLSSTLGTAPSLNTWAFPSGLARSTAQALSRVGAQQVVVPGANLSLLPSDYLGLTFGQPAKMYLGGSTLSVIGADPELAAQLKIAAVPRQAALVADQLLAELAMIDLERPGDLRGVVLMAPPGVSIGPSVLRPLIAGLNANPLLQAVTLDDEFDSVPAAVQSDLPLSRQLTGQQSPEPLAGVSQLPAAEQAVQADNEVFAARAGTVASYSQSLLDSLSSTLTTAQREAVVASVLASARGQLAKVRLPAPVPITLTSLSGQLPLTVLSAANTPARVTLVLSSEELSFTTRRFPEGACSPTGPGTAQCVLTLSHAATILQVPISVRTPGVFQLLLQLETQDGRAILDTSTQTVRSTAFPDFGLVVLIAAALFLAVWWARNARHGRRAHQLVPRPADDDASDASAGDGSAGAGAAGAGAAGAGAGAPSPRGTG